MNLFDMSGESRRHHRLLSRGIGRAIAETEWPSMAPGW